MCLDMPADERCAGTRHRREKLGRIHRLNCGAQGPDKALKETRNEIATRRLQREAYLVKE